MSDQTSITVTTTNGTSAPCPPYSTGGVWVDTSGNVHSSLNGVVMGIDMAGKTVKVYGDIHDFTYDLSCGSLENDFRLTDGVAMRIYEKVLENELYANFLRERISLIFLQSSHPSLKILKCVLNELERESDNG